MNKTTNSKLKEFEALEKYPIRYIPVDSILKKIVYELVQSKDVFHIGFYLENDHLDINVHEFLDFKDIYYEVNERLRDMNIDPFIRIQILKNIVINKNIINKNLRYFGGINICST